MDLSRGGNEPGTGSAPRLAALLVAGAALLAYLPVLMGGSEFLEHDDDRFVRDNTEVHSLDPGQAVRYFTDPTTVATKGWRGIYRPIRTLEFSIDWAISGGRPWFFHLRNVFYHVLGSVLVLALFRRLLPGEPRAALLGALLFAVHPVHTESVAWITSRGDVLLLVTFLGALLLHMSGRRVAAALVLVLSLFSKEGAVVFPAAAFLADLYRREPLRFKWYAAYGAISAAYFAVWLLVKASLGGDGPFGHNAVWWGGSYGADLLTVARSQVMYAGQILLPVRPAMDYYVTATTGFDLGAALGTLLVLGAALAAWRGGRQVRFAVLWFAATLLPVANVLFTVGAPNADRFLYLPMVGLSFLGGCLFSRTRLSVVPLACFLLLTMARSGDWRTEDRLMSANRKVALTQAGSFDLAGRELGLAHEASKRGDREEVLRHARTVVEVVDELRESYRERLGRRPMPQMLERKAAALGLMGEYGESLQAAREAIALGGGAHAWYYAGEALSKLHRFESAAEHIERAHELGFREFDLRPMAAWLLNAAARRREEAGEREAARALYERTLRILPEPGQQLNADAREGLRRLGR